MKGLKYIGVTLAALAFFVTPEAGVTQAPDPDFLLSHPDWTLTVRGGGFLPRADSELFEFVRERFTVRRTDFQAPEAAIELSLPITPKLVLAAELGANSTTVDSEERDWVEETPQGTFAPVTQSTRIRVIPSLSAGLKIYPWDTGEAVGRFAWIPSLAAPYVEMGTGGLWWRLDQWGDFVVTQGDEADSIITAEFATGGAALLAYAGGGMDLSLTPSMVLNVDTRYRWATGDLSGEFMDFRDGLDLSGLRVALGIALRR